MQLSPGDGTADVVQIAPGQTTAPNLVRLLTDPTVLKIFHFARFDVAVLAKTFGVTVAPVYCTKIASRLTRTYTDRHGLKDLVKELLDVDLSKQQQSSDWAAETLTDAQLAYAASDVLYLHALRRASRRAAGARGQDRSGRFLLPFPADAGRARSCRLAGRGHLRPFLNAATWSRVGLEFI